MNSTRNKLIIVSAPSGAGKTTIVHHLLSRPLGLEFSVSATSRPPRTGEVNGHDYFFLNEAEFRQKIDEQAFVEWEEVYPGIFYGTLQSEIERIWQKGHAVIFDVDVVGGLHLKRIFGDKALALFVMPPSVEVLHQRLRGRSTDSEEKIATRIAKADYELSFAPQFDKIIVNDDLTSAFLEAEKVVGEFLTDQSPDRSLKPETETSD
ncbi:MAG TPA: guanylate kinase [Prolixibacteraceae bacterium]|jgi:guanylate kinase|nr:guanylate kinase [Prolixibacteraceae bacterium]